MLRYKILFLPLLSILLTLGAGLVITKTIIPQQVEEGFQNQLVEQTQKIKQDITSYFNGFVTASLVISKDPIYLSEDKTAIVNEMRKMVDSSIQISGLALFDQQGDLEAIYPAPQTNEKINVKERKYFQHALQHNEGFLSDLVYAQTGRIIVVNGVPIVDSVTGEVVRVLGVSLNLLESNFSQGLLQGPHIGFDGYSYIIDSKGRILSHPNAAWIGQDGALAESTAILQTHSTHNDQVTQIVGQNSTEMMAAYIRIDGLNWGVIAQVPLDSLNKGKDEQFSTLAYYYLIIAILMILITFFLTGRIMKPLYELESSMHKIIEGDLSQTIELSKNQHDLGSMVDAFNKMVHIISENRRELETKAFHDSLTGLYNHRMFQELLQKEFNTSMKRNIPLTLMFLDIDRFKLVNDNLGHQAGDQVLKRISELLVENVRPSDSVSRYGGEEIVIICPNTDMSTAEVMAERIRSAIKEYPFKAGSFQLDGKITVSVGVASTDVDPVDNKDEFIKLADQRMYLAKQRGRDRVVLRSF
jgi:diguanylate cyclase (GGDEF)-like protein